MESSRRQGLTKLAAGITVFCSGVATSLAIATPSAQPRSADCLLTVVCTDTLPTLPTTLPSLPTTLTTLTETVTLPTGSGTTSGSTTGSSTTGSATSGSTTTGGSSGQGPSPTTTSTVGTEASVGHQRVSLKRFRASIRRVGRRRWLTITFEASKAGRGSIRLTIPRRRAFVKAFSTRAGKNRQRFLLPARAGKGRRQLLLIIRSTGGDARVRAVVKLPS